MKSQGTSKAGERLTLEQRVERLEKELFPNGFPKICPRCKIDAYEVWQEGVCANCAYMKGDQL